MRKKTFSHRPLFKALMLLVFGVFYFVQVQAKFITCTYNNYEPANVSATKQSHASHLTPKNPHTRSLIKYNKRYQSVNFIAILPEEISIEKQYAADVKPWYVYFSGIPVNFPYCISPRGPPAFD